MKGVIARTALVVAVAVSCLSNATGGEVDNVDIRLKMAKDTWKEGDDVRLEIEVTNHSDKELVVTSGMRRREDMGIIGFLFWEGDKLAKEETEVCADSVFGWRKLEDARIPGKASIKVSVSLPVCAIFNARFPADIIPAATEEPIVRTRFGGYPPPLISASGKYGIQARLWLSGRKNPVISNRLDWKSVPLGTELARAHTTRSDERQWEVIAYRPAVKSEEKEPAEQRGTVVLAYRRRYLPPGHIGVFGIGELSDPGFIPNTVLAELKAAPKALVAEAVPALRGEDIPEAGSDEERLQQLYGLCWVLWQVEDTTSAAMLGYWKKRAPFTVEKGKALVAVETRDDGIAVALFSEEDKAVTRWSYRVLHPQGGTAVEESRPLPGLTGQAQVKLSRKEHRIAAESVPVTGAGNVIGADCELPDK